MSADGRPVAVIGAGVAGLTAAAALRRHGVPVRVYEAGRQIAGMAASFQDQDGFTYDFGAHFITNRLAAAIGVGAECRDVQYYGETVVLDGRAHRYPLGIALRPRFLMSAGVGRLRQTLRHERIESAADWFRAAYGRALADSVAIPLVEAWSGAPAEELAPAVGEKLGGSIPQMLLLRLASRVLGKAVASGYCREQPESMHVWHVYPNGGVATLCHRLADGLEDVLQLEAKVDGIIVEDGRVVSVSVNGQLQEAAGVMSTAPVHVLAKLVHGTTALESLARFRYRPMVFVNLRLTGRHLLPDVVTWTPEQRFPFFRVTEAPWSMPWLAPPEKTLLTVDIGCETHEAIWSMPDDALVELCLEHLQALVPDIRRRYLGGRVLRTPIAYPLFLRAYEPERQAFSRSSGVEGLYSIGRNGEFAHILMEDVYWRTLRHVADLLRSRSAPGRTPGLKPRVVPAEVG